MQQDFGDLTHRGSRGILVVLLKFNSWMFWRWSGTPTKINTIDFVTIATTGNATDFGDLTLARRFNGWDFLMFMEG